jgi:hypothetical protein
MSDHGYGRAHDAAAPMIVSPRRARRRSPSPRPVIWRRVAKQLPWAAAQRITAHCWLRHTTVTWVERNHGYAVARAHAGHVEQCPGPICGNHTHLGPPVPARTDGHPPGERLSRISTAPLASTVDLYVAGQWVPVAGSVPVSR